VPPNKPCTLFFKKQKTEKILNLFKK
jgi:hypothetical protein